MAKKKKKDSYFAAYGFLTLVEPDASIQDAIDDYAGLDAVTFAHAFVGGSFDGFVVVKTNAFEGIQSFILGPARPARRADRLVHLGDGGVGHQGAAQEVRGHGGGTAPRVVDPRQHGTAQGAGGARGDRCALRGEDHC